MGECVCVCIVYKRPNLFVYESNTIISYFIAKYTDIHHLFGLSILAGDAIQMRMAAISPKSISDFGFCERDRERKKASKTI